VEAGLSDEGGTLAFSQIWKNVFEKWRENVNIALLMMMTCLKLHTC
jgi:hypothetical protein